MSLFKKNTAVTGFPFSLIATADGAAITSGTPVGYVTLDGGTQTAIGDVSPVHEGNGQWTFDLTAGEMNGDVVGFLVIHSSAINVHFVIKTDTKITSELNDAVTAPTAVQNRTEMDSNSIDLNTIITDIATAQSDLDIITDTDGVTLATAQGNYAPAKAGDAMTLTAAATSAQLVDDIWDEALSGHNSGGTTGKSLNNAADYVITDGTAQSGAAGKITLASGESATDDIYVGQTIIITGGTGVGQVKSIIKYVGSSKEATTVPVWEITPDVTSLYQIIPGTVHAASGWDTLHECYAQAGTSTTITLSTFGSTVNDYYQYQQVVIHSGTGAGQVRIITGYVGSTRVATVNRAWDTTPDTTSQYLVQPDAHAPYLAQVLLDTLLAGHTTAGSVGKAITDTETDADAIKTKTDQMTYTKANELDSNTKSINDAEVIGDGNSTPWDGV